jgi:hypothetical protein
MGAGRDRNKHLELIPQVRARENALNQSVSISVNFLDLPRNSPGPLDMTVPRPR